ncbi:MAG: 3-hydroxybutyryl-CoA dehydrogenase [Bacteroidetes bacterium]|nr:3-hydroxybutyryl-CoA dehydrogenase [Bacteroidota bacterium]
MENIKTIGIAGAGTMGAGIAQVCAQAGFKVILFDLQPTILDKAKASIQSSLNKLEASGKIPADSALNYISNITFTHKFEDITCDLIIEAIIEKLEAKIELFNQLMEINGTACIYATNTSSIPITKISAGLKYPELLVGIHFFNPAQIMKLVEIIKGARTKSEIVQISRDFVLKVGKVPVIAADAPGFIVNRVARLYYVESLKMLEEGVADIETIDQIMESCGFKMGPFRLMDLIGVDTNYAVTESQYQLFNYEPRFRPNRIQKQKVDAGLHGRKTKEGFYKYE